MELLRNLLLLAAALALAALIGLAAQSVGLLGEGASEPAAEAEAEESKADSPPPRPAAPAQPEEGHHDDPAGFRVPVPAGWTLRQQSGGLIRADITKGKTAGLQVRFYEGPRGGFDAFVEMAVRSYREDMAGHWGGTVVETAREPIAAGEAGWTVRFRAERENGTAYYLQESFILGGERVVLLQCGCPWDERERYAPVFDRIAAGVTFTKVEPDSGKD